MQMCKVKHLSPLYQWSKQSWDSVGEYNQSLIILSSSESGPSSTIYTL